VKSFSIRISLFCAAVCLTPMPLVGQGWDAARSAVGWAKQDKDDSFTFYDAATRTLHTWARDGGLMASLPLAKLDGPPVRWALDPRNNAWVAHGATLSLVERTGRILTSLRLPAEVGDLCWDAKGFVISYRTLEPYVEKRGFKSGELLWSFGSKPSHKEGTAILIRRPVVLDDSGSVLIAEGYTTALSVLDSGTGQKIGEISFQKNGSPIPNLEGSNLERGPIAVWPGKGVVLASLNASQLPISLRTGHQGLVLARLDTARMNCDFLPTGLVEGHLLVGVLDSDAVFSTPNGGLVLIPLK
jgi:hypothetical protein